MRPNKGFFAHGGSENYNHGPMRCACMDLATGEIVFDEDYAKNKREGMDKGTNQDAATISILSAITVAHRRNVEPIVYSTSPEAINRAKNFLIWAETGEPPYPAFDREWHPLIMKALKPIDFDVKDVQILKWNKKEYGENPLALGWDGK